MRHIVFYRYDDRRLGAGRCTTDHHLAKGDLIYAKGGRARVTACVADVAIRSTVGAARGRSLLDAVEAAERAATALGVAAAVGIAALSAAAPEPAQHPAPPDLSFLFNSQG